MKMQKAKFLLVSGLFTFKACFFLDKSVSWVLFFKKRDKDHLLDLMLGHDCPLRKYPNQRIACKADHIENSRKRVLHILQM